MYRGRRASSPSASLISWMHDVSAASLTATPAQQHLHLRAHLLQLRRVQRPQTHRLQRLPHLRGHRSAEERLQRVGLVTDALLLNPWDREALTPDGRFDWHPEYRGAFEQQGREPDASLLIDATPFVLARSR